MGSHNFSVVPTVGRLKKMRQQNVIIPSAETPKSCWNASCIPRKLPNQDILKTMTVEGVPTAAVAVHYADKAFRRGIRCRDWG